MLYYIEQYLRHQMPVYYHKLQRHLFLLIIMDRLYLQVQLKTLWSRMWMKLLRKQMKNISIRWRFMCWASFRWRYRSKVVIYCIKLIIHNRSSSNNKLEIVDLLYNSSSNNNNQIITNLKYNSIYKQSH